MSLRGFKTSPLAVVSIVFAAVSLAAILASCAKKVEGNQSEELHKLFANYWEYQMKEFPTWATFKGDKRYDSLLDDPSAEAVERRHAEYQNFRNDLRAINRETLSETDKVSADMFDVVLTREIEGDKFKDYTMPMDHQGGPQTMLADLIQSTTFVTKQDYENYLKRMQAYPEYMEKQIDNMMEGMKLGLVPAKNSIEPVVEQINAFLVDDPTKSVYYSPIRDNKASLSSEDIDDLGARYQQAIKEDILPTYQRLKEFVQDEYLPKCRDEFGIWSLPDGAERYQYLIKYHTTLALTPEEITKTGMDEIARIETQMDSIISKVGFEGTRQEFFNYLHTNKRFYYTSKDSLLNDYRKILAGIKARMGELFGTLPQADCQVREMEEYRSFNAPTAYYEGPSDDGSRPGYFVANTYNLSARPKYEMEALTYHEGIPGHHLQISIAQEQKDLPKFRQNSWFTAFGEGWGLYAEGLPKELGFYSDPYSEFGRLQYQAWRACRLVVDCGLHYYKWDRQKAIDFMKEHFGGTEQNIEAEVDRYIAWPGQALGYKIGQLKILELRHKAEKELGDKFSVREFHDQVLNEGTLPLTVLETKIDEWIAKKKRGV